MLPVITGPVQRQRRQFLTLTGSWVATGLMDQAAGAEPPSGWVQPRKPTPSLKIVSSDGRQMSLSQALFGKISAVQLMFTGCSSTCPVQGALFAAVASQLRSKDVQLLSISIDALGDSPATVAAWQARFGRHPAWNTAVSDLNDVDRLGDFMKGVTAKPGTHTAQVFLFDTKAQLAFRTGDSPGVGELDGLITRLARTA
jgi:protein SCO1